MEFSLVALLWSACVLGAMCAPIAHYTVVVSANSTDETVRYAASELQSGLTNLTGQPVRLLNVSASNPAPHGPLFVVGPKAATLVFGVAVNSLGLQAEGYAVLNGTAGVRFANDSVVVTGCTGEGGGRGTLYGVYHLLESLGAHWWAWDCTTWGPVPASVPASVFVVLPQPVFQSRGVNSWTLQNNGQFAVRRRANYMFVYNTTYRTMGRAYLYADPPGFGTTAYRLVGTYKQKNPNQPPPTLYAAHPEWFWPQDNASVYGQLCWSNASLVQYVIQQVRGFLRSQPHVNRIDVSNNDNLLYCQTPKEMKIIQEEGSVAGPLLRAVNTIADAIAEEFPHVVVDTLAYQWTLPPPKITTARPNVIVRVCDIEFNFGKPLTDPSNLGLQVALKGWAQRAAPGATWVWNYVTNFGDFVMPFPNWYVVGPNVQFFAQNGVSGLYEEAAYASPGGDMNELKDYVMTSMIWDPTLDDRKLITEFLAAYYEQAAPFVRIYLDIFHAAVADTDFYMPENFPVTVPLFPPQTVVVAAQAIHEALALPLSPEVRRRVNRIKICLYYVVLLKWAEVTTFLTENGLPWPLEPAHTKEATFNEFARIYKLERISQLSESGHDITWLQKRVFGG